MKQQIIRNLIVVVLVFCSCGFGYSQSIERKDSVKRRWVSEFGLGYTIYSIHKMDKSSLELRYSLEKKIKEPFYINTGCNISYSHFYFFNNNDILLGVNYRKLLFLQLPFSLRTDIYKSKLFVISGVFLNFNLLKYGGSIPEKYSEPDIFFGFLPVISFGYHVGLLYKPAKKIGIYVELKSLNQLEFGSDSSIEIGLSYQIKPNVN